MGPGAKILLSALILQAVLAGLDAAEKRGKEKKGKGIDKKGKSVTGITGDADGSDGEALNDLPTPPKPASSPAKTRTNRSQAPTSQASPAAMIDADDDSDPDPDPFFENKKWSNFVHRVDAIVEQLRNLLNPLATVLSGAKDDPASFSKGFAKHFNPLKEFFDPLHDELVDGAAHTQVNPAIGLTDLKKLNEWSQNPPTKFLDQARMKWMEVNGMAVTAHYIFDRLKPIIEKWGLEDVRDWTETGYPTYILGISGYSGGDRSTYELRELDDLTADINKEIDGGGGNKHMMRSLEKILRKHLSSWDPESDYNIFCYGNNEFGIIHDTFDLLTDAAFYLSIADMKHAVLNATFLVLQQYESTYGSVDGSTPPTGVSVDIKSKINDILTDMKSRIDRKIRIAAVAPGTDEIIPGPTTFKCDKPPLGPGETPGGPTPEPTTQQPPGHVWPEGVKPPRIPPGGTAPLYPTSQWGKPAPEPLSPKVDEKAPDGYSIIDPQPGPEHPLPAGYIDKRPANFEFAAFSQAFTGYLEAETVLNPDGSCKSTCPDFRRPTPTCENKSIDCPGYRQEYCEPGKNCLEKSTCDKEARKCIRTAYEISYCPSSKPSRLYDWIDINGTLVGKELDDGKRSCDSEILKVRERWEMDFGIILNAPQYCEVCMCVCDSPMTADGIHHFDIQPVVAAPGHVITAIKFVQQDNVVRLSAEQGKLLDNGKIDESTISWIAPPESDKKSPAKTPQLGADDGFRSIGLDMVYATTHEVITGVKFILKDEVLHLSVQGSAVNGDTGALKGTPGTWRESNYPLPAPQKKTVLMDDKVSSIKQQGPSQPFNKPDNSRVVQFDASSLLLDAGQAVIPFFDIQATRNHLTRKPLNAIGLLYKSKKGYGGFISPTVTPYRKFFV